MRVRKLDENGGIVSGLLGLILGIIVTLIGLRILFDLFNVGQASGFVSWVYSTSEPLVSPFYGILNTSVNAGTGGFDLAALLALIVYGVIGGIVTGFLSRSKTV